MGYTHYWTPRTIKPKAWAKVQTDMAKLFASVDTLCREYDRPTESPCIDKDLLVFNGKGPDGHETFWIDRASTEWTFCKTAHKPYDTAICAVLVYLANLHAYEVTSDGTTAEWSDGLALARKIWPDHALVMPAGIED